MEWPTKPVQPAVPYKTAEANGNWVPRDAPMRVNHCTLLPVYLHIDHCTLPSVSLHIDHCARIATSIIVHYYQYLANQIEY